MDEQRTGASPDPSPRPLEYRSAKDERRQWPKWVQATIGFILAGGTSGFLNLYGGASAALSHLSTGQALGVVSAFAVAPVVLFVPIGLLMRRRGWWRAFLPGALAGWGVAALAAGLCFIGMRN